MEIAWYGQSCFRLRSRGLAVVTDPYGAESGLRLPRLTATVVTVSQAQADHNNAQAVKGSPFVISGPGEYEIEGIFVIGVATSVETHQQNGDPLTNTAYLIEFEDLTICHLGGLVRTLSQEQAEQLNEVDVLLLPVGGHSTLSSSQAAEVVGLLEPRIVIPMHFRIPGLSVQLDDVSRFLKELGAEAVERLESLTVSKGQLPDESRVVLLEPKQ
jgi:L-ascorbate metabolism protein UlaG (beta-lactamase superfamily)